MRQHATRTIEHNSQGLMIRIHTRDSMLRKASSLKLLGNFAMEEIDGDPREPDNLFVIDVGRNKRHLQTLSWSRFSLNIQTSRAMRVDSNESLFDRRMADV